MGLFDALKGVTAAVGNAVNDYKEQKAYEAAEDDMLQEVAEDLFLFINEQLENLTIEELEPVMATQIRFYKSFRKEGYADAYDILEAIAEDQDVGAWKADFTNKNDIDGSLSFYRKYYGDALEADWFKDTVKPFYEDDAEIKLVGILNQFLGLELPDRAAEITTEKYGEGIKGLRLFLEDKEYDFYDPFVAFRLNDFEDDDVDDNLNSYEKNCLKKYTNVVRNTRLEKYRLGNGESDVQQIRMQNDKINYCAAIRDNCLCYMQITFPDIKQISDLRKYTTMEAKKIPLSQILYWKECGEQRTEVGLKKENAVVNAYAASKGVVLPKQLEERKVDTRYIALAFEKGEMDLD